MFVFFIQFKFVTYIPDTDDTIPSTIFNNIQLFSQSLYQRQIVKDFLIKFTKIYKKGARSTVWLLTPRLIDYIFPFSRSLQRYA